jgi:hypothetical protein
MRYASNGPLNIYTNIGKDHTPNIIGITFEDDNLNGLQRQCYLHYLGHQDTSEVSGQFLSLRVGNGDVQDHQGDGTLQWTIKFDSGCLSKAYADVFSCLKKRLLQGRSVADMSPVEREYVYWRLRHDLVELPHPKAIKTPLGHWPHRISHKTGSAMSLTSPLTPSLTSPTKLLIEDVTPRQDVLDVKQVQALAATMPIPTGTNIDEGALEPVLKRLIQQELLLRGYPNKDKHDPYRSFEGLARNLICLAFASHGLSFRRSTTDTSGLERMVAIQVKEALEPLKRQYQFVVQDLQE